MAYEDPGVALSKIADAIGLLANAMQTHARAMEYRARVDERALKFDMEEAGYEEQDDADSENVRLPDVQPHDGSNADDGGGRQSAA
jgi:hypothetical protein